jgi:hypothetical protein
MDGARRRNSDRLALLLGYTPAKILCWPTTVQRTPLHHKRQADSSDASRRGRRPRGTATSKKFKPPPWHIIYRNFVCGPLIPALHPLTAGIRGRLPHAVMSLLVGNWRDTGSGSKLLGGLFDVPPHTPLDAAHMARVCFCPSFLHPAATYIHTYIFVQKRRPAACAGKPNGSRVRGRNILGTYSSRVALLKSG